MNTNDSTVSTLSIAAGNPANPEPPPGPAHPAKGNQRGQTTLAAEIDRWLALVNNLAPQIDQFPAIREPFTRFQALVTGAVTARNQLNTLRAETAVALDQRNQFLLDGADLFFRLSLALQAVHGPESPRLKEFGLKPRRRTGRPRKSAIPPTSPPPTVEILS